MGILGIANFPPIPNNSNDDDDDIVNVWNNAIENIFLPAKPEREATSIVNKRHKTSHRLLTTNQVIEEKQEALKKEEKLLKKEKRDQIKKQTK